MTVDPETGNLVVIPCEGDQAFVVDPSGGSSSVRIPFRTANPVFGSEGVLYLVVVPT
jgi:hypothetical protein